MHDLLNNLPDQIALLDHTATILQTNRSWQKRHPDSNGLNFLQFYKETTNNPDIKNVRLAIQKIIGGKQSTFTSGLRQQGCPFAMQITHSPQNKEQLMVSLRDISTVKLAEQPQVPQAEIEQLNETNIALNSLLKNREQDRAIQEGAIVANVKQLIMPYLDRLQEAPLAPQEETLVTIIREYLNNIISPFLHRLSTVNQQLTPQELKIASLIRQGRSSKEIATALQLTVNGVAFHRKSLRHKLGLTGSGKNLRSQLMALR